MSVKDPSKKFFYCGECKIGFETDEFLTLGDDVVADCPVCDKSSLECSHHVYNLTKAWSKATGPKTPEGKERVALNGWKNGKYCTVVRTMAPAKFAKMPWCPGCEFRDSCEAKEIKYCPKDMETLATFIAAFKDGNPGGLREQAGFANAQTWKIFMMMIHEILEKGVMVGKPVFDSKGNALRDSDNKPIMEYEKNHLIKEIPSFVASMGFNADAQVMTPKSAEQQESLRGHLANEELQQEAQIEVLKRTHDELAKFRELIEDSKSEKGTVNSE